MLAARFGATLILLGARRSMLLRGGKVLVLCELVGDALSLTLKVLAVNVSYAAVNLIYDHFTADPRHSCVHKVPLESLRVKLLDLFAQLSRPLLCLHGFDALLIPLLFDAAHVAHIAAFTRAVLDGAFDGLGLLTLKLLNLLQQLELTVLCRLISLLSLAGNQLLHLG